MALCAIQTARLLSSIPPGAGKGNGQGTIAWSINDAGVISGQYQDTSGVYHGFVRAADGKIRTYDVPGAGTGSSQGTQPSVINNPGAITGDYIDASGVLHGYLAKGFSDLKYSDILPEASGRFNDQRPSNGLGATTCRAKGDNPKAERHSARVSQEQDHSIFHESDQAARSRAASSAKPTGVCVYRPCSKTIVVPRS